MTIKPGALRFNTDSMKLEIFRGSANYEGSASMAGIGTLAAGQWEEIQATSPDIQTGGTRGLAMGGYNPSNTYLDEIVYINIASTGNSLAFGELTVSDRNHVNMGTSDRTRAISAGGQKHPSTLTGDIEYVTMASTGNAVDFGADLTGSKYGGASASNGTRGIFAGGWDGSTQISDIEYITIQSTGVAAQDFGDLTLARNYPASGMCSPTRACFAGGRQHPSYYNTIDYITMSTQGNAADFGDLTEPRGFATQGITSNSVRGITAGGYAVPAYYNYIDYITIPTLGNATDFGDLLSVRGSSMGVTSPTRCVMIGGASPAYTNVIQYVQIMTTGNAVDFGDMHTQITAWGAGASNGHGGL
jgi:hypothetical protein